MALQEDVRRALGRGGDLILTTRGRRSGRPRPVELSFALQGDLILLLGHPQSQWPRNLKANPRATVEVGGLHLLVAAEMSANREALNRAWEAFTRKYGRAYMDEWYERTERIPIVLRVVDSAMK